MFEFYATFDYVGITDPVNCDEYDNERDAYYQWERELHCAAVQWGDDLLAYRALSRNITNRRVSVRFVVASPLPVVEQVEAIQTLLFDEGGLSGSFVIGRERPFYVTYEVTREVWAIDAAAAGESKPIGLLIRIEDPENVRAREPAEDDTVEFRDIAKEE